MHWALFRSGRLLLRLQYLFPKVKSKNYIATGRRITRQWCMTECTQSLYGKGGGFGIYLFGSK